MFKSSHMQTSTFEMDNYSYFPQRLLWMHSWTYWFWLSSWLSMCSMLMTSWIICMLVSLWWEDHILSSLLLWHCSDITDKCRSWKLSKTRSTQKEKVSNSPHTKKRYFISSKRSENNLANQFIWDNQTSIFPGAHSWSKMTTFKSLTAYQLLNSKW